MYTVDSIYYGRCSKRTYLSTGHCRYFPVVYYKCIILYRDNENNRQARHYYLNNNNYSILYVGMSLVVYISKLLGFYFSML